MFRSAKELGRIFHYRALLLFEKEMLLETQKLSLGKVSSGEISFKATLVQSAVKIFLATRPAVT